MSKNNMERTIGGWAFIVGLVIAAIVAIVGSNKTQPWVIVLLVVLGIIVGLLNVTSKESTPFLIATIAFMLTFTSFVKLTEMIGSIGTGIDTFLQLVIVFVASSAAIVAFKALFAIAKN